MKKAYLSYGMVMMACFIGHWGTAAIIVDDDFSTYTGGDINGQAGSPTGLSGFWGASDASISGNTLIMTGNDFFGASAFRNLSANTAFPSDGSSAYIAMTITPRGTLDDGDFFQITSNPGSGDWSFGFSSNQFSILNHAILGGAVVADTTYTLVSRLTRNDAGAESIVLWIDPTDESDTPLLSGTIGAIPSGTDNLDDVAFFLSDNENETLDLHGFSIGESFDDVVAVPEPSALGLLFLGAACFSLRKRRATLVTMNI